MLLLLMKTHGIVRITIEAEVLSVKQGGEEIQPDSTFDKASVRTTLVADYGASENVPERWTITYRI